MAGSSTRIASPQVPRSPAKRRGGGAEEGGGMEALRRLGRRVKPFEQVGVPGFLAFTVVLFLLIFCFFYSNRGGLVWPGRVASDGDVSGLGVEIDPSKRGGLVWPGRVASNGDVSGLGVEIDPSKRGGGGGGGECDWFDGEWVWDEKYPLYESRDCGFLLDEGFRCSENGRKDQFYTKWRWQPALCDLPRF